MKLNRKNLEQFSKFIDGAIIFAGAITFCYWFTGKGLFYSDHSPVMSPFTSFSLVLMALSRLASKLLFTWSTPMTLALFGIVSCGNLSSLWIQLVSPELFLNTIPGVVPTSVMTSLGLVAFCFYEILIIVRKTPDSAFIFDDILLHLALVPGGLSLLGHILGVQAYMSSSLDPRVGIGYMEMAFMGSYAVVAVISNPHLFLWRFLARSVFNRFTFLLLVINQYIAPIIVGYFFRNPEMSTNKYGIEFYVMLAGVLATLIFLVINAVCKNCLEQVSDIAKSH
jgi:hypothetical protein